MPAHNPAGPTTLLLQGLDNQLPCAQLQTVMLPTSVVSVEILQADELSMSSQLPPLTDFPSTSQVLYGVRMSNTRQGAGFLADSLE